MSKKAYDDFIEGTYVEPGHDVAPNAWVADGSPTRQKGITVTTDREREEKRQWELLGILRSEPSWKECQEAADEMETLMRENEAMRLELTALKNTEFFYRSFPEKFDDHN